MDVTAVAHQGAGQYQAAHAEGGAKRYWNSLEGGWLGLL